MVTLTNRETGFKLANIVLNQKKSFTLEALMRQMQQQGIEANELTLKHSLNRLCDNGMIIHHGSFYSVPFND